MQRFDEGELTMVALSAEDFERADAEESHSEGIIDQLRALQGTKVAVLVRELSSGERKGQHKVSLRATDDDVDVSIIARAQGGGGHRRAAGFSTDARTRRSWSSSCAARSPRSCTGGADGHAAATARLSERRPASAPARRDGRRAADRQARRDELARRRRRRAALARRRARRGHAGTLDPFATGLLLVLSGAPRNRSSADGAAQAL